MTMRQRIALILIFIAAMLIVSARIVVSPGVAPVPIGQEPLRATPVADAGQVASQAIVEGETFSDTSARYSLTIPAGWRTGNYPGLFLSPDAEGRVGYADVSGMALMVDRSSKDAASDLGRWLADAERARYLIRPLNALTTVEDRPALLYEASWDTQGHAVTAFIDDGNLVLRISCFYQADASRLPCLDVLSQLLPTVRLQTRTGDWR